LEIKIGLIFEYFNGKKNKWLVGFQRDKSSHVGFERKIKLSCLLCSLVWKRSKFHDMKHDMSSYSVSKVWNV
jgi:hypothetical protein